MNILVTGANGDIGGAFARELAQRGDRIFAPIRDLTKPSAQALLAVPNIIGSQCKIENSEEANRYIKSLADDGIVLDAFILAAGTFKWDKEFESVDAAIAYLTGANFATKENIFAALDASMHDHQKNMIGIGISSHAAQFGIDHPWRTGEEGYVISMAKTSARIRELVKRFQYLILEEPGLINTEMARREFTKETIGETPEWDTIITPQAYVRGVLDRTGL